MEQTCKGLEFAASASICNNLDIRTYIHMFYFPFHTYTKRTYKLLQLHCKINYPAAYHSPLDLAPANVILRRMLFFESNEREKREIRASEHTVPCICMLHIAYIFHRRLSMSVVLVFVKCRHVCSAVAHEAHSLLLAQTEVQAH